MGCSVNGDSIYHIANKKELGLGIESLSASPKLVIINNNEHSSRSYCVPGSVLIVSRALTQFVLRIMLQSRYVYCQVQFEKRKRGMDKVTISP